MTPMWDWGSKDLSISEGTHKVNCKKCNQLLFAGDFQKVHFEGKIRCSCGNVICFVCCDTINQLAAHNRVLINNKQPGH